MPFSGQAGSTVLLTTIYSSSGRPDLYSLFRFLLGLLDDLSAELYVESKPSGHVRRSIGRGGFGRE